IFGPAVFDPHILAFDIAGAFKALAKRAQTVRHPVRRSGLEIPDDGHRRLLRARRERPRGSRAAEQRDEVAAGGHSITSSARPISGSGTVRPRALAVLRLMASVYLSARWTGRSPGLVPLRMRST